MKGPKRSFDNKENIHFGNENVKFHVISENQEENLGLLIISH